MENPPQPITRVIKLFAFSHVLGMVYVLHHSLLHQPKKAFISLVFFFRNPFANGVPDVYRAFGLTRRKWLLALRSGTRRPTNREIQIYVAP